MPGLIGIGHDDHATAARFVETDVATVNKPASAGMEHSGALGSPGEVGDGVFPERPQPGGSDAAGGEHFEQVIGGRVHSSQGRKVFPMPSRHGAAELAVFGGEAGLQLGCKREPGVIHVQRPENASGQERFKIHPGFQGHGLIQHPAVQAGVHMRRSRGGGQSVVGDERAKLLGGEAGQGSLRALGVNGVAERGPQPGGFLGQVAHSDWLAVVGGHFDRRGQVLFHRIIRLHLPALDHVFQEQKEEGAAGGLDREQGVAVGLPIGAVIQVAATDHSRSMLVHQADHHAAMRQLGMDVVLQVSGDGISKLLRPGFKWHAAEKQGKADDSDDSLVVHVLRQKQTGRMPV